MSLNCPVFRLSVCHALEQSNLKTQKMAAINYYVFFVEHFVLSSQKIVIVAKLVLTLNMSTTI